MGNIFQRNQDVIPVRERLIHDALLLVLCSGFLRQTIENVPSDIVKVCAQYAQKQFLTYYSGTEWDTTGHMHGRTCVRIDKDVVEWIWDGPKRIYSRLNVTEGVHEWKLLLEEVQEKAVHSKGLSIGIMQRSSTGSTMIFHGWNPRVGTVSSGQAIKPIALRSGDLVTVILDVNDKQLRILKGRSQLVEMEITVHELSLEYCLSVLHDCQGNKIRLLSHRGRIEIDEAGRSRDIIKSQSIPFSCLSF